LHLIPDSPQLDGGLFEIMIIEKQQADRFAQALTFYAID